MELATRPVEGATEAEAGDVQLVPAPVQPAFSVPTPQPLAAGAAPSIWAPVLRPVVARAHPSATAPRVARLGEVTPEGTTNIVLVLGPAADAVGRAWVRVRLPVLPNNSTGWIPRNSLGGYVPVDTRLVVDREALTATLFDGGRPVFRARVGIGTAASPTPAGHFYVRNRLTKFRSPFYGPIAFGTSARSPVLTDWPAGGFIGIHGTNQPSLIPGRVSHGCVRMRNGDIRRLARLMPIGTPIVVR